MTLEQPHISILGGGAFGTALALSLQKKARITVWCRSPETKQKLAQQGLHAVTSLTDLPPAQATLMATPTQTLPEVSQAFFKTGARPHPLVLCAKGLLLPKGLLQSQFLKDTAPQWPLAVLSGPAFAKDLHAKKPTAMSLAVESPELNFLQSLLSTNNIRLYQNRDLIGTQVGGALKNIIALACGFTIGTGAGESARSALMTRGFSEMLRIAKYLGGSPQTLLGLSGLGDLTLTCHSEESRNLRFGISIGRTGHFIPPEKLVEGYYSVAAVKELLTQTEDPFPILQTVYNILYESASLEEMSKTLLERPLKREDDLL